VHPSLGIFRVSPKIYFEISGDSFHSIDLIKPCIQSPYNIGAYHGRAAGGQQRHEGSTGFWVYAAEVEFPIQLHLILSVLSPLSCSYDKPSTTSRPVLRLYHLRPKLHTFSTTHGLEWGSQSQRKENPRYVQLSYHQPELINSPPLHFTVIIYKDIR
jgi:hypothetical protein